MGPATPGPWVVPAVTGGGSVSGGSVLSEQDVDRVAVAGARGMAAEPVEVLGVALSDLVERPALVAAEVEPLVAAIGAQRTARRPVGSGLRRRRRGSAPPVGLPEGALDGIADDRIGPVEVGHPLFARLVERSAGIGVE